MAYRWATGPWMRGGVAVAPSARSDHEYSSRSLDHHPVTECWDDVPVNYFSAVGIPGHSSPHGPEPRRAEAGRWPELEAALVLVNRDLSATLPGQDPFLLMLDPSWAPASRGAVDGDQIHVAMSDGRWHGASVNVWDLDEDDSSEPYDAATALAVVADAAQETLVELLRHVWPICSTHNIGVHPRPPGTTDSWYQGQPAAVGPPVWWCRGGRDGECHDVAQVGKLAETLPGKQRRALRRGERHQSGRR